MPKPTSHSSFSLPSDRQLGAVGEERIYGQINNIPQGQWVTVWSDATLYQLLEVPENIVITSSDAGDSVVGVGGQIVALNGIDSNGELVDQNWILQGTNPAIPVGTPPEIFRVLRVSVVRVGTFRGSNLGTIEIRGATTDTLLGIILPGVSLSYNGILSVPSNMDGYVKTVTFGVRRTQGNLGSTQATFAGWAKIPGATGAELLINETQITSAASPWTNTFNPPVKVPAGFDLEYRVFTDDANMGANVLFSAMLWPLD